MTARNSEPAHRLVALLADMQKAQEVTPDSFYVYARQLRHAILCEQDSVSQAVYSATLAHLYVVNSFRAQTGVRETESQTDSLQEWSRQEYLQNAANLYGKALARPDQLYEEPVGKWVPVVDKPNSTKGLSGDMLNMIWHAAVNDLPAVYRQKVRIPTYARLVSYYRSKGKYGEALSLMLDSLDRNGITAQDSTLLCQLKNARCTKTYVHSP